MKKNCKPRNTSREVVRAEQGWCVSSIRELKGFCFCFVCLKISTTLLCVSVGKYLYACMGSSFVCGVKECIVEILTSTAVRCAILHPISRDENQQHTEKKLRSNCFSYWIQIIFLSYVKERRGYGLPKSECVVN